jgi:tetraacyldisaccharide 4'-kinase
LSAPAPLVPLLRLAALAYGGAIRLRNRRWDRPGHARHAPLPVLSLGNLTVGGTGKTPLAGWLARRLADAGRRPAIVSRGYGGTAGRGPLVVSRGDGPACDAAVCGDEPYLLATRLPGVAVVVGSDRHAGAVAAARMGCDVAVLDDGFQHRRLSRDLDLLLLDASDPFGNGRLLPAGPLREPVASLGRADVVVLTRSGPEESHARIEREVRRHNLSAPIVRAGHRRVGFFDAGGRPAPRPARAVAFCGIGNPGGFRRDLEEEGVDIAGFAAYRDHHRYTQSELQRLVRRAGEASAALVTTEKDRVRIATWGDGPEILALRIEAEVFDPETLMRPVRQALGDGSR